jgi:hypothetical protein
MPSQQIRLSNHFVDLLVRLPENGMGYQLVKIFLKNGTVLSKHKVLNSSILVLNENESISEEDIEKIELE